MKQGSRPQEEQARMKVQLRVAVMLTIFKMLLVACAFAVPPLGEIHQSVLAVTGEIFTLVGALLIADYQLTRPRKTD